MQELSACFAFPSYLLFKARRRNCDGSLSFSSLLLFAQQLKAFFSLVERSGCEINLKTLTSRFHHYKFFQQLLLLDYTFTSIMSASRCKNSNQK